MWKLDRPNSKARKTFRVCISRVRDTELKARLESVEDDVVDASREYNIAALASELHTIATGVSVGGQVTRDEMIAVYDSRMAKSGAPGRPIYDELLLSPEHGRCPLCGHRIVTTLDHQLPKAHYPALAVTPVNLVPACSDCNKARSDTIPQTYEDVTLHPYFDDIQDDRWLYARVVETDPAGVSFFVVPPNHWDAGTEARVRRHFDLLKLAQLYASQAAQELVSIRKYLEDLHLSGGAQAVQVYLVEILGSLAQAATNSWRTATYEAFASSGWFCEGGFG